MNTVDDLKRYFDEGRNIYRRPSVQVLFNEIDRLSAALARTEEERRRSFQILRKADTYITRLIGEYGLGFSEASEHPLIEEIRQALAAAEQGGG